MNLQASVPIGEHRLGSSQSAELQTSHWEPYQSCHDQEQSDFTVPRLIQVKLCRRIGGRCQMCQSLAYNAYWWLQSTVQLTVKWENPGECRKQIGISKWSRQLQGGLYAFRMSEIMKAQTTEAGSGCNAYRFDCSVSFISATYLDKNTKQDRQPHRVAKRFQPLQNERHS